MCGGRGAFFQPQYPLPASSLEIQLGLGLLDRGPAFLQLRGVELFGFPQLVEGMLVLHPARGRFLLRQFNFQCRRPGFELLQLGPVLAKLRLNLIELRLQLRVRDRSRPVGLHKSVWPSLTKTSCSVPSISARRVDFERGEPCNRR